MKWIDTDRKAPPLVESVLAYWIRFNEDGSVKSEEYGIVVRMDKGEYVLPDALGAVTSKPTFWCRIEPPKAKPKNPVIL